MKMKRNIKLYERKIIKTKLIYDCYTWETLEQMTSKELFKTFKAIKALRKERTPENNISYVVEGKYLVNVTSPDNRLVYVGEYHHLKHKNSKKES